jgi:hypothetical protein
MQFVEVKVHKNGMFVDPPITTLADGDDSGVTWQFVGIPNDVVPFIQFGSNLPSGALGFPPPAGTPVGGGPVPAGGLPPYLFGPFTELSVRATQIVGRGNLGRGSAGDHSYMVSLQRLQPLAKQIVGFGVVTNQSGPAPGPNFLVTYDPKNPDPMKRYDIEPERIVVNPGDLVTWQLQGPHLVDVVPLPLFFSGPIGPNPSGLGPFDTISMLRVDAGGGPDGIHYRMIGHGVDHLQGTYQFDLELFQAGGGRLPSLREGLRSISNPLDPSIDPPPPPTDGGNKP